MVRLVVLLLLVSFAGPAAADDLVLYGAGSLRGAITAVTTDFTKRTGVAVRSSFGPSGLMRDKIEAGDKVDVFTSADMGHALKLEKDGRAELATMFTRNRLCAFAKRDVGMTSANLADKLVSDGVKLGTSTPKADPSGDYTWEIFKLIDKTDRGAFDVLDAKAKKVTGGTTDAPAGDPVAAAFARGDINVMIGYCSGADQMRAATPDLDVVQFPPEYAVGPEYGMAVMNLKNVDAVRLAFSILAPQGQAILARFGFQPIGLPNP